LHELVHLGVDGGAQVGAGGFPGGVEAGAPCLAKQAATLGRGKVVCPEGLFFEQPQCKAVNQRPDRLQQVRRERLATKVKLVVKAHVRVESGAKEGDGDFGVRQGLAEREGGVEGTSD